MSQIVRFFARITAILLIIGGTTIIVAAWWAARQPLRLPASTYTFDVKSGATLKSIARDLRNAGVLPHEYALVALARVRRADRAIKRVREIGGNVLLFSSGHFLRVLAARWLGLEPRAGRFLLLSTASLSALSYEHNLSQPAIRLLDDDHHVGN